MQNQNLKCALLISAFQLCCWLNCFSQPLADCSNVKNGIFYTYPQNSNDQWKSERNGDLQTEINLVLQDTSAWKISWVNNCQYSLKYLSGGKKFKKEEIAFLKDHSFTYVINSISPEFYVATSYIDVATNYPISIDTLWHKSKNVTANRVLFSALTQAEVRKAKFKDTSKYALLYVYRPSKFVCSGIQFPLYGNDILMCALPEKGAAYIFKIWKQGNLRLQGQHKKNKDHTDLYIRFGQKYYVRIDTKWSLARCIPFMMEMENEKGEEGFVNAQY